MTELSVALENSDMNDKEKKRVLDLIIAGGARTALSM